MPNGRRGGSAAHLDGQVEVLLARLPFVRLGVERWAQLQGRCSAWMGRNQAAVPPGQTGASAVNYSWLKELFRETVGLDG